MVPYNWFDDCVLSDSVRLPLICNCLVMWRSVCCCLQWIGTEKEFCDCLLPSFRAWPESGIHSRAWPKAADLSMFQMQASSFVCRYVEWCGMDAIMKLQNIGRGKEEKHDKTANFYARALPPMPVLLHGKHLGILIKGFALVMFSLRSPIKEWIQDLSSSACTSRKV